MKKIIIFFIILFYQYSFSSSLELSQKEMTFLKDHPLIILGSDKTWVPNIIIDSNENITGYDVDILNLINTISGANFQLELGVWSSIVQKAKNKEIDGLSTSSIQEERKKYFNFSNSYISFPKLLIVSSKNDEIKSIDDLKGKSIAYQSGNIAQKKLIDKFKEIKAIEYNSSFSILNAIIKGEVDATISGPLLLYLAVDANLPYLKIADDIANSKIDLVFSIRKDWPEAISIINKALNAIPSYEIDKLKSKWIFPEQKKIISDIPSVVLTKEEEEYLKNKKTLSLCIDPNWMPFEEYKDGTHIGITSDYIKIIQERLNIPIIHIETKNFMDSLEYSIERKCDLLSLAIKTKRTQQYLDFTKTYLSTSLVIASNINEPFIDDLSKVQDKSIGIVSTYGYANTLIKKYPNIEFIHINNVKEGLEAVYSGDLFAFIGTLASVGYKIQKNYIGLLKITGKLNEKINIGMASRNDEPLLKDIMNKAFASISKHERELIYNKWVFVKYDKSYNSSTFYAISLAMFLLLFIFLYRERILRKHYNELMLISRTDILTKINNRLSLDEFLDISIYKNKRYKTPFSIILIDIDNFKEVNDIYGHSIGDKVLVDIVNVLKINLRKSDIIGRWGGEEFLIICPNTTINDTVSLAEKLRIKVSLNKFTTVGKKTISLGIVEYSSDQTAGQLFIKADFLLYKAKNDGKNISKY